MLGGEGISLEKGKGCRVCKSCYSPQEHRLRFGIDEEKIYLKHCISLSHYVV